MSERERDARGTSPRRGGAVASVSGRGPIVVAGEALVDLALPPRGALSAHSGGGPFNAARAAARLGAPTAFLGRISRDRLGARLREELAADGVDLSTAVATDDPTTLALAELDAAGSAAYRFYVEGTSAPGLIAADVAAVMPPRAAALAVGTLGLVFEPTAATLEALVAEADDETLVLLDPNCRPLAIPDADAYRARLARVLARTDVVKASEDDLAWLAPGVGPAEAMRMLLAGGAGLASAAGGVGAAAQAGGPAGLESAADGEGAAAQAGPAVGFVTLGGDGALVVTAEEEVAVPAPRIAVADTIGAGDAFAGALLAWWHRAGLSRHGLAQRDAAVEAARFACRAAAIACERPGADPPWASELDPPAAAREAGA